MNKEILSWNDKKNIKIIANELKNGGVVLGTSDTILGFLAVVDEQGMALLNRIKGRFDKPYIILIGEKSRLLDFTDRVPCQVQTLIDACWPGPLTLIVKAKAGLSKGLQGANGTIALRVPRHEGLLELLGNIPALFSTSANKAGMPVPSCIKEIDPKILAEVDLLVVDDFQGSVCPEVKPSTIIDCTGPQLKVIRLGAYSIDMLKDITGQNF